MTKTSDYIFDDVADIVFYLKEIFGQDVCAEERRVRALIGVGTYMLMYLWNRLVNTGTIPVGAQFKHIVWTLYYLKGYPTVDSCCTTFSTTQKTLRQWVWRFIDVFYEWQVDVVSFTRQPQYCDYWILTHVCFNFS
jgi:hypothetical protein